MTLGLDVSDKKLNLCVLDRTGEVLSESIHANDRASVEAICADYPDPSEVCIAMETGTHSPWLSSFFRQRGFHVLVGNPRKLRAIWSSDHKTDARDAEMLARIARFDPKLLYPIKHRSLDAHMDLAVIKSRDMLVKTRSKLVSSMRGQLKCYGVIPPKCGADCFPKKIVPFIPKGLRPAMNPLLTAMLQLNRQIRVLESKLEKLAKNKYPEANRLRQIGGVGPITSLAFVLTLESPDFLVRNRDVGPYLGLVPGKDSSGETEKDLSITKAGNRMLRSLLVGCAQYILGAFGPDCDLRRFGLGVFQRKGGDKVAKRKAVVATARKLAVILHAIWRDQGDYVPLRPKRKAQV